MPPSEIRQWMWGFHFKSRPKVWRTRMKPGVNFSALLSLWNNRMITLWTASKRRERSFLSSRKKCLSSESMVKTQCLCWTLIILKDIEVVRSMEYLFPQVGQKRLWHRKGTNLKVPQDEQPYIAPPKEGSPQLIILSTFSMTDLRGCRVYNISS